MPTLAPFLQADLALTRAEVGLFNSALMAGSFVSLFLAGKMVDLEGERSALFRGNLLVGIACVAVLGAGNFASALVMFFLAGIGASFATPAGSRTVMRFFPPASRGAAIGVRQTGIPLGGALAAAILPVIALHWGWRWSLAASGLVCIAAGEICRRRYPGHSQEARAAAREGVPRPLRALLTRDVWLLGLSGALLPLGQFALVTYLALYLRETQGIPITTSALLLVAAQLGGAAGRILWGICSDRLFSGRRKPALMLATLLSALGSAVLGVLPPATTPALIGTLVVLYAFNTIGWHGIWISLVAEIAGPAEQGRTIGAAMTVMYAGIILLPPLFGLLVDITHDWRTAWCLLALALLAGALLIAPVREGGRAD